MLCRFRLEQWKAKAKATATRLLSGSCFLERRRILFGDVAVTAVCYRYTRCKQLMLILCVFRLYFISVLKLNESNCVFDFKRGSFLQQSGIDKFPVSLTQYTPTTMMTRERKMLQQVTDEYLNSL